MNVVKLQLMSEKFKSRKTFIHVFLFIRVQGAGAAVHLSLPDHHSHEMLSLQHVLCLLAGNTLTPQPGGAQEATDSF